MRSAAETVVARARRIAAYRVLIRSTSVLLGSGGTNTRYGTAAPRWTRGRRWARGGTGAFPDAPPAGRMMVGLFGEPAADSIMQSVTLEEAQTHLAEIVEQLAPGEEIVLTRQDKPVATLRATPQPPRKTRQ